MLRGQEGSNKFLDRDLFETDEGYIFCVVAEHHPPDRVTSYLKYMPTRRQTLWRKHSTGLERIMKTYGASQYEKSREIVREICKKYVVYDRYLNIELIQVPIEDVRIHYRPEERVREIMREPGDSLEELAKELIETLSDYSEIPIDYLGITGSLLAKIHNIERSDIDLLVYSKRNTLRALDTLRELAEKNITIFDKKMIEICVNDVSKYIKGLDREKLAKIVKRRMPRMMFRGRIFSINFVRTFQERYERYGEHYYRKICPVRIRARVVDSSESYYNPAIYTIDDVRPIEPLDVPRICEVASYENIFSGIARDNEEIVVYGMLEKKVHISSGRESYRVVIGSVELKGYDYILPLE
ncbi:MAG: hypothetical protein GXO23_01860 [Crenarchaeota archaeon]|nr:hypothetical protein [Thermoproteota archaeon]